MSLLKPYVKIALILCRIFAMLKFCEGLNPDNVDLDLITEYPCEGFDQKILFNVDMHEANEERGKAADVEFILNEEFTEYFQSSLMIDHWKDGEWSPLWSPANDTACNFINRYAPGVWKKFKDQLTPSVSGDCSADPDTYKATDFEIKRDDYSVPMDTTGRYKSKVIVSDELDEPVFCHEFVIDIVERS